MDFWSRLIARTSLAPIDRNSRNPEKRAKRFKNEYYQLLSGTLNTFDEIEAAETIRSILQELTNILSDESRRPLPHPCIAFASTEKIYIKIGEIAILSSSEGIIRESVAIFATLVESEEEDFVENNLFSQSLMRLLDHVSRADVIRLGRNTEVEVVELAFNITTKIRLNPSILPAWFTSPPLTQNHEEEVGSSEKFTGKTNKQDFPLFYLLINYIHHEGRIGDFARTGLLYIIESASSSGSLEHWIVVSDLATLMATGLGALYSQLSRKLVIDYPDDELAPVLALSDYQHPITTLEIVSSLSPEFKMQVETFISHLLFWQDVLNHCKSIYIKQTLLEHFRVIFLQQLLYPSLLESSDLDGGSSVAVLTYLRRILEALDHPDMIHLILNYLLALPDSLHDLPSCSTNARGSISEARQRKSLDLATMMASQIELKQTPALFNLVDLIHGSLKSPSNETISVTLQLISVILKRHHRYAVTTLFRTSQILSSAPHRTIGAHDGVMDFLLCLAGHIGGDHSILDEIYSNHISDCLNILESHQCSITMILPQSFGASSKSPGSPATIPGAPRDVRPHTLRPDDPMLQIMVSMLTTFLTNPVEINLSLTAVIIDLATCGYMRLDGWLLPDSSKYVYEDENENSFNLRNPDYLGAEVNNKINSINLARRIPIWTKLQIPDLLEQLKKIIDQINFFKAQIPRFDELLQQRREAFLTASSTIYTPIPVPVRHQQPQSNMDSSLLTSSRLNTFDSFTQRIFSERSTPARSKSPRGRKNQDRTNKLVISPSIATNSGSRSVSTTPQSQMTLEIPSTESFRLNSSNLIESVENILKFNEASMSQPIPLGAVDQSILTKKVGLPLTDKVSKTEMDNNCEERREHDKDMAKICECAQNFISNESEENYEKEKLVSVNHLLTNVIIVQEFLLELAALLQVRASLFGEVRYA